MEQAIRIVLSRLNNLRQEYEIPHLGSMRYDEIQAAINELESLLDELLQAAINELESSLDELLNDA